MSTKCRFRIYELREVVGSRPTGKKTESGYDEYEPAQMFTVLASPVYGNGDPNHPNTKFWQATPSGHFEIGTVNAAAVEGWKPGKVIEFTINLLDDESKK